MHNNSPEAYALRAENIQPWIAHSEAALLQQRAIQKLLSEKAGVVFGKGCYVAEDANVFTSRMSLGDRSWIASGAIVRGTIDIAADCSINPYAHLAGRVSIGRGCRIAANVSIYGFNHGFSRTDVFIKDQPTTSKGVKLHEDIWVGAGAIILDGVEIGPHSIVAAGAVVTKSFGAFQIIGGNPARVLSDRRSSGGTADVAGAAPKPPRMNVRRRLYEQDPYDNLVRTFPEDLQGWGSTEPIFRTLLAEIRPKLIVEVGSWKGASAIHMAALCKELGIAGTEIVCIDTWLGNWQNWSRKSGTGSREDLRLVNGMPMLYFQFLSNVKSQGHADIITPLPLTGVAGARLFHDFDLRPELVYLDGDHEYESALFDLRGWLDRLAGNGVLLGDDYNWPGVRRAVEEVAAEGAWVLAVHGHKFTFRRRGPA